MKKRYTVMLAIVSSALLFTGCGGAPRRGGGSGTPFLLLMLIAILVTLLLSAIAVFIYIAVSPNGVKNIEEGVHLVLTKMSELAAKLIKATPAVKEKVIQTTQMASSAISAGVENAKQFANDRKGTEMSILNPDDWELIDSGEENLEEKTVFQSSIPLCSDKCCICGRSLEYGQPILFTVSSGKESFIDYECNKKLYILKNSDDFDEVNDAYRFFYGKLTLVDPAVRSTLNGFLNYAYKRFQ